MGYLSLRKGRYSAAQAMYVVTTATRGRRHIFISDIACTLMRESIASSEQKNRLVALCWLLMPDHLHLLLQLADTSSLSAAVNTLKADSARRINRALGCSGQLWQRGFYDHQLRDDEDARTQARYLIANPLRAGLVTKVRDYPHWYAIWAPPPFGPARHSDPLGQLLEK